MLLKTHLKPSAEAQRRRENRAIGRSGHRAIGRSGHRAIGLLLAVVLLLFGVGMAEANARRLILKDGSYQMATKWEVKGDRVRYYSAERYMWEELPTSLVDWNATEKWAKEHAAAVNEAAAAQIAADKAEEEAASPTVAPGVRLPETGGIFLLDNYAKRASLVELVQQGTQVNKQTGKNILRAVINPLPSGPKETIELKGPHARVQAHETIPQIFVNINFDNDAGGTAEAAVQMSKDQRFKIVRVRQDKASRVIADLKIGLLGSTKEQRNVIPTRAESVGTNWLKLTPVKPLEPGEYALVEMLSPKQMNLYVWDFGVDPKAPANPTAWKPLDQRIAPTVTEESPVLSPRPKH